MRVQDDAFNLLQFFYNELVIYKKGIVKTKDILEKFDWDGNRINLAYRYLYDSGLLKSTNDSGNIQGAHRFSVIGLSPKGINVVEQGRDGVQRNNVLKDLSILTGDESLLNPNKILEPSELFKNEHDPSKTVFIMMKFQNGDSEKNEKLQNLYDTIQLELIKYRLDAVRADEKNYSMTDYIWDNLKVYLNECNYGMAILENLYSDEINPNVAMEYGYMLAKDKKVLLLKEKSFTNIRADILGKIWKGFEFDDMESVKKAIQNWMVNLNLLRMKA